MAKKSVQLTSKSKQLISRLERFKIDLKAIFKVIGIGYRKEVRAVFGHQQPRDAGLRWEPLSERYARWKELHYPGKGILVRTGALLDSMTKQNIAGNITIITDVQAIFGSSIYYGKFHDDGTLRLPKRNFSEPSDRRKGIWLRQIEGDIVRQFQAKGIDVSGGIL